MPARRFVPVVAFCAAAAVIAAPSVAPAADPATVTSEHFEVVSDGPADEAAELSRVLEAAWPQLLAFFGTPPKLGKGERLSVRFVETKEAMDAAIRAGKGTPPSVAGGYYCPVARTSYGFRQPSRWYTRTLILHEVVHQFHLRGAASGSSRSPVAWWTEGLAEHLSHHTWDGTTLRLGVVPPVTLEDRPAEALKAATAPGFAPQTILTEVPFDRPRSMHLVRYFATADAGRLVPAMKEFGKSLDHGAVVRPGALFRDVGGETGFRARFVDWLRTVQQPFVSECVEWDSLAADAVRGIGAVISICRTRGPATSITATATVADTSKKWRVGALLEWTGLDDYVIGQVTDGGRTRVDRRRAGAWAVLHEGPVPDAAGSSPWRIAARREGGRVTFSVGDADVFSTESYAGPLGLCLDSCTAEFRGIVVK